MTFHRREFLGDVLVLGGGLLAGACTKKAAKAREPGQDTPAPGDAPVPAGSWQAVRAAFDLDPAYLHFTGFLLVSHPRPVREAIERFRRELDRNPALYMERQHGTAENNDRRTRSAAAAFLGAEHDEVALTDSTTMGLGLLYGGFVLAPGQEIVTTEHDHYSTHEALRFRARRSGAKVHKVALYDRGADANEAEIAGRLRAAITPRTRVVAITWVHSGTGVKLPIRAIADMVAEVNRGRDGKDRALLCVDGVHGFGIDNFKVADLGCDFFVAGCHKWLFGPRGTGLLWGKASEWHNVERTIPPFEGPAYGPWLRGQVPPAEPGGIMMTPGGYHSFEHRWALAEAFGFHEQIGRDRIEARIHALNTQLKDGLAAMKHVTLHTPRAPALSAGIVCFEVAGMEPAQVAEALLENNIVASSSPYPVSYARLAPSLLNDPDEVDTALAAVRALA